MKRNVYYSNVFMYGWQRTEMNFFFFPFPQKLITEKTIVRHQHLRACYSTNKQNIYT